MQPTTEHLRRQAIRHTMFPATDLKSAIERLNFVQADPIRAPATAQDLILRQRVKRYQSGDLEKHYPELDIEEDLFYAYGFLPKEIWQLLHPRNTKGLGKLEKKVLEAVRENGTMHPRELEAQFGKEIVVNAWGGYSKVTKRALEDLHYRGLLRVCRREKGIRVYQPTAPPDHRLTFEERSKQLVMVVVNILAPCQQKTVLETMSRLRHSLPGFKDTKSVLSQLLKTGELEQHVVDDVTYLYPATAGSAGWAEEVPEMVRFLAPFDPLVWDRRRFEHLWGWQYRFEAYTPPKKRLRGYYSLPLLFDDRIVGWVNANLLEGKLEMEAGFVDQSEGNGRLARPINYKSDRAFRQQFDAEAERLRQFLNLKANALKRRLS